MQSQEESGVKPDRQRSNQLWLVRLGVAAAIVLSIVLAATALKPSPGPAADTPTLDTTPDPGVAIDTELHAGAGIIIAGQGGGPFPNSVYALTASKWIEHKPEMTIEVLAGARRNPNGWQNLGVGLIIVVYTGPQGRHEAEYETTTKGEQLFIVDAVGERLILRTQNGKALYFDVPARQFVTGLTVTVSPAESTQFVSTTPARCVTEAPPQITRPPTNTPEPFVSGIFTSQRFQAMGYSFSNWWHGMVNSELVDVIAGAREDNPGVSQDASQGVLMVATYRPDGTNWNFLTYEAPYTNTGVLTIVAVNVYRLTLQAQSGAALYFDVPTRHFVGSLTLTSSAPTATKLPSNTLTVVAQVPTAELILTSYPGPTTSQSAIVPTTPCAAYP